MSDADSDFFPAALHAGRSLDRLLDDTNGDSSSVRHIEMNIVIRDLLPDRVLRVTVGSVIVVGGAARGLLLPGLVLEVEVLCLILGVI